MLLNRMTVDKFRNIARVDLELTGGVTLIWGRNAQGKTNLLEAAHYLATGRSFRTRIDRECLPWDGAAGTVARIEGRVERATTSHDLAISLTDRAKFAWIDGKPVARLGQLLGQMVVVLFTPGDIQISAGSPAMRRRFLDMALSQVSPAYLHALQTYSQALRERNAALRSADRWFAGRSGAEAPDPWAELLVEHGVTATLIRRETVDRLREPLAEIYREIAPNDPGLGLDYRSGAGIEPGDDRGRAVERYRRRLSESAERDRARGQTLAGPHRDELGLKIGDREVRDYGSQGQQRSAALALRLAELRWIGGQIDEQPILLVDDLGAELDRDRRTRLLGLFAAGAQTLATTAGDPDRLGRIMSADRALEVCGGEVKEP